MSTVTAPTPPAGASSRRAAWLWVNLSVAAAAMVATLPGRTIGLSTVTEPLQADLGRDGVWFGHVNFWATLLGAAFCLPVGRLLDNFGTRRVLAGVMVGLGLAVLGMAGARGAAVMAVLVLLTRGFGQSALSVVSLSVVGKSFPRERQGPAMGAFSVLTGVGFAAAVAALKAAYDAGAGWRAVWAGVGGAVLVLAVPLTVLLREPPAPPPEPAGRPGDDDATLAEALRSPAFWAFALASALYNLVISGLLLFNESILNDRGIAGKEFLNVQAVMFLVGIAANLLAGWLARRWPLGRLLGVGSLLLAAAVLALPRIESGSLPQAYLVAAVLALSGGAVMVTFFAVWRFAYGWTHLGRIQGAAQTLTVLSSALGPLLFAEWRARAGSYTPALDASAAAALALGVWVWVVALPRRGRDGSLY
jgi:MFS family permease